jgi:uncharacterized damage-inducible protein DinB
MVSSKAQEEAVRRMSDQRLAEALRHLHPPPGVRPWHGGATVLGALRGLDPKVAEWKPYPDRHSIWELALHVAYWNYAVRRRLTGEAAGGFPRSPANWPSMPEVHTPETWKQDRRLVRIEHDRLVEALRSFNVARMDHRAGDGTTTFADLITGILLHDTYHAGQIQVMKRLARSHGL